MHPFFRSLFLLFLFRCISMAQPPQDSLILRGQNSGTTLFTRSAGLITLNCTGGLNCAWSNGVFQFAAPGAACTRTRTSATNLSVSACTVTVGTHSAFTVAADSTCALTASAADTALAYWQNGTFVIGMNDAGSSVACAGWTPAVGIAAFPAGSIPLWSYAATTTPGSWNATDTTERLGLAGGFRAGAGVGIVLTESGSTGIHEIAVDTATTPQFTSGTAAAPASCTIGQIYIKTDTNTFYACTSTNTFTALN